jgi:hypothetical protein
MKDTLTTLVTGAAGVSAVQVAEAIPTADEIQSYGQLFIQLVIGIITVVKMLRKKKNNAVSDQIQD